MSNDVDLRGGVEPKEEDAPVFKIPDPVRTRLKRIEERRAILHEQYIGMVVTCRETLGLDEGWLFDPARGVFVASEGSPAEQPAENDKA